jgi:hypothetical protein
MVSKCLVFVQLRIAGDLALKNAVKVVSGVEIVCRGEPRGTQANGSVNAADQAGAGAVSSNEGRLGVRRGEAS